MDGLKHNIFGISQLCDKGLKINFNKDASIIEDEIFHEIKLVGKRINNIFMISLDDVSLNILWLKIIMIHDFGIQKLFIFIWII